MNGEQLVVLRLGRVEYEDGLQLQALYGRARSEGLTPDVLLLLEHPPVLTMGRGAKRSNVLASDEALRADGVDVFETNRGGDVTYHGPGQLVGYPILLLPPERRDVRRYVRDLEQTLIQTLARYGLEARSVPKWPGVWVGAEGTPGFAKIAALGVHFSRWLTSHGFALNVNTRLEHFGLIVPCGIREAGVTSMQERLGRHLPLGEVEDVIIEAFAGIFDFAPVAHDVALRTVSVAVHRDGQVLCLRRRAERGGFWQLITGRLEPGEAPHEAASRELEEETGWRGQVHSLDYRHTFAFGESLPPLLCEESAYAARAPEGWEPQLADEHDGYEWLPLASALERLPFVGLRRAAGLALGVGRAPSNS